MKHCSIDTMTRKIALLTLPLHSNYGGILQCYALQTVLERMGCEVTVLNRHPKKPMSLVLLFLFRCVSMFKCMFRRYLLGEKEWRVQKPWDSYYMPCRAKAMLGGNPRFLQAFVREHIHQTKPLYSSQELGQAAQDGKFDSFVVGSDQVWREEYAPEITDYFLGFLPDSDRRPKVAYAASFGLERVGISDEKLERCRQLSQKFTSVSVREQSAVRLAKEVLAIDARWVLDPTLLLTAEDYQFAGRSKGKNWAGLVTYILDSSEGKSQMVDDVAIALSLPVKAISLCPLDKNGFPAVMLPVEWWHDAFAQADFVVTDSFHGCVFSIINRKPFIAIANHERGLDRFTSLLGQLGLMNRLVFSVEEYSQNRKTLLAPIDYVPVEKRLCELRKCSLAFLREALGL